LPPRALSLRDALPISVGSTRRPTLEAQRTAGVDTRKRGRGGIVSYRSATTRLGLTGGGAELLESELRRVGTVPVSRLDDGGDVPPLTTVIVVETFEPDERWRDWELRETAVWDLLGTALEKMSNPARMLIIGLSGSDSARHRKDVRKYLEYLAGEVRVIAVNAYGIDVT